MTRRSRRLGLRYLAFVNHAFDRETGRFRNFLSHARHWLEPCGSEDSQGRALWALGAGRTGGRSRSPESRWRSLPRRHSRRDGLHQSAAWAYALLGLDEHLKAFQGDSTAEA